MTSDRDNAISDICDKVSVLRAVCRMSNLEVSDGELLLAAAAMSDGCTSESPKGSIKLPNQGCLQPD